MDDDKIITGYRMNSNQFWYYWYWACDKQKVTNIGLIRNTGNITESDWKDILEQTAGFYHGGMVTENAMKELAELAHGKVSEEVILNTLGAW